MVCPLLVEVPTGPRFEKVAELDKRTRAPCRKAAKSSASLRAAAPRAAHSGLRASRQSAKRRSVARPSSSSRSSSSNKSKTGPRTSGMLPRQVARAVQGRAWAQEARPQASGNRKLRSREIVKGSERPEQCRAAEPAAFFAASNIAPPRANCENYVGRPASSLGLSPAPRLLPVGRRRRLCLLLSGLAVNLSRRGRVKPRLSARQRAPGALLLAAACRP